MDKFTDQLRTLYKYRSLGEPFGRATARDIILESRMFWQSPAAFNDPFDCKPVLQFGQTRLGREAFARRAARNTMPDAPRWQRRHARQSVERRSPTENTRILQEGFDQWMQNSAVTCFSAIPDSLLMWGHYASAHTGVCFRFQEQLRPEPFIALEVQYTRERPLVDITNIRHPEVYVQVVLTKAAEWSYEKESRMIDYRQPAGLRSFPINALSGVILGARITEEDRAFVLDLVGRRTPAIEVLQAKLDDRMFQVKVEPAR